MVRNSREDEVITWEEATEQKIERRSSFALVYQVTYPDKWLSPDEVKIIWGLAVGKCGTNTCTNLLKLADDVVAYHDAAPRMWNLQKEAFKGHIFPGQFWTAKVDQLSAVCSLGYTYADINHNATSLASTVEHLFTDAKYLFMMRDLDSSVVSLVRWGVFSKQGDRSGDKYKIYNKEIKDIRLMCAWYWYETNKWALDFLETIPDERKFYIPFSAIRDGDVEYLEKMYERFEIKPPKDGVIRGVLDLKSNETREASRVEVPKNWEWYDVKAEELYARAKQMFGVDTQ